MLNGFVRLVSLGMSASVVGLVVLLALYASVDAHANTNPCNDGGVASVHMVNATTGESECYDMPPAYDGETYTGAFWRFYGFVPCHAYYVLAEDGSCVYNPSQYAATGA